MKNVNIIIECNNEHIPSIYTLVASIVYNKAKQSKYNIYMLCDEKFTDVWEDILKEEKENVNIEICARDMKSLAKKGVKRAICLKWNTIVMGDLQNLYTAYMEDKSQAMVRNIPKVAFNIQNGGKEYNEAVKLVDLTKEENEEIEMLDIHYNFGYEEFVNNKEKISESKSGVSANTIENIKKCALILRCDETIHPEKYFDTPLADVWMEYFQKSAIKDKNIIRYSSVENVGKANAEKNENVIPILLSVSDKNIEDLVRLVQSIKANTKRQLDVRISYEQLLDTNKKAVLECADDKCNIVLYNIKKIAKKYSNKTFEIYATALFEDYDKVVSVDSDLICNEDIGNIYDIDIDGYYMGLILEMSGINLINIREWRENKINEKITEILKDKYYKNMSAMDVVKVVCGRKIRNLDNIYKFEKIAADIEEGDEKVQEVLKKIAELEEANEKLQMKNKQLEDANSKLTKEKNEYLYQIIETRKSVTYKIGRMITLIPRKIRGSK